MVPYHDAVPSPENDGLAWQRGLSSTPSVSTMCSSYSPVYCCSISLLLTTICCALHVFFFALNAAVQYPRVLRFVLEHGSGYGSGYGSGCVGFVPHSGAIVPYASGKNHISGPPCVFVLFLAPPLSHLIASCLFTSC